MSKTFKPVTGHDDGKNLQFAVRLPIDLVRSTASSAMRRNIPFSVQLRKYIEWGAETDKEFWDDKSWFRQLKGEA